MLVAATRRADLAAVAARGGADGVHVDPILDEVTMLRERLTGDRIIGVGGLRSQDDAMTVGEAGVDYLLFGEPRPDGFLPPLDAVLERAAWWAEIFETPCVAFAPSLEAVPRLAADAGGIRRARRSRLGPPGGAGRRRPNRPRRPCGGWCNQGRRPVKRCKRAKGI